MPVATPSYWVEMTTETITKTQTSTYNRKMENLTPCKIVTPENFFETWHVIMSRTSPTTQIFMYIAAVGASPQIGEI